MSESNREEREKLLELFVAAFSLRYGEKSVLPKENWPSPILDAIDESLDRAYQRGMLRAGEIADGCHRSEDEHMGDEEPCPLEIGDLIRRESEGK